MTFNKGPFQKVAGLALAPGCSWSLGLLYLALCSGTSEACSSLSSGGSGNMGCIRVYAESRLTVTFAHIPLAKAGPTAKLSNPGAGMYAPLLVGQTLKSHW